MGRQPVYGVVNRGCKRLLKNLLKEISISKILIADFSTELARRKRASAVQLELRMALRLLCGAHNREGV
jgi:hypothetical protein